MTLWTQHWHICIKGHKTYLHQSATNHTNENLSCPIHECYWLQHHTIENWSSIHEHYWLQHHTNENLSCPIHEHYWLQHHTNENWSCPIHEYYWLQHHTIENWSSIHEHYWLQHHTNENLSCLIHEHYWLQRYTNENWSCPIHEHYWLQHHTNENWSCPIHEYCLWPCQSQEALRNFPVPEDAVVLQILLLWCCRSCCSMVFQKILLLWCCRSCCSVVFQKILLLWCCRSCCSMVFQKILLHRGVPEDLVAVVSIFFQFGQLHVLTQTVWWLSPLWVTCWEVFTELHKHTLIGMAWLSVLTVSNGGK